MSDLVNALNSYNRNSGVLNQISNPTTVNPSGSYMNALQFAALLKQLQGGQGTAGGNAGNMDLSTMSPQQLAMLMRMFGGNNSGASTNALNPFNMGQR